MCHHNDSVRTALLLASLLLVGSMECTAQGGGSDPQTAAPPSAMAADELRTPLDQAFSYYTVSGATLRGRNSASDVVYAGSGCSYLASGTGALLFLNTEAPIPDGSRIKYLRIYYYDTNASNGVSAYLTRYAPGVVGEDLTSVASTAAFAAGYGSSLSAEIDEIVDGTSYAYTVIGRPDVAGSNNRICGMRVAYYAPNFFANGFE